MTDYRGIENRFRDNNIPLPPERAEELTQTLGFMTGIGYVRMEEVPKIPRLPRTPGAIVYAPLGDTPVTLADYDRGRRQALATE